MDNLIQLHLALEVIMFLCVILMNLVKKNTLLLMLYLIQSVSLTVLLGSQALVEKSIALYAVVLFMFIIKVITTPLVFTKVIRQGNLNISTSTYLNVPLTSGALLGICLFAQSDIFSSFAFLADSIPQLRLLLLGGIFMSLFLIINRKGVISEVIGILSLENFIYSTSLFLGAQQLTYLELGILFDVLFWIIVARVLINFIYKHYGSFEVTELTQLRK